MKYLSKTLFVILIFSLLLIRCKKSEETPSIEYSAVTDIDGNEYKAVTIGEQTWMAEDLKTTKFNDGTEILNVTDNDEWSNLSAAAYCWYDNDETTYKEQYGALYNWYVIEMDKNVCPVGWHVPSSEEWTTLRDFIADDGHTRNTVAKLLKAKTGWEVNTGTDNYGFSALPSGLRFFNSGSFRDAVQNGYWWSSTPDVDETAVGRYIQFGGNILYTFSYHRNYGIAIRCVKDN